MRYLVGDLQGCCGAFDRLLQQIDFSPSRDHLVVLGDLVNRGPQSLAVLQRLRGLGEAATCLLGIRGGPSRSVTEEEIAAQLEEGLDAGVIEEQEHQMVRNVFRLDDRQIGSMMIPRAEIVWIDANAALDLSLIHI